MKTKYCRILSLLLLFAVLFAGCSASPSSTSSTETQEKEDVFIFGFSNNNDIYPYCAKFHSYLVEEAEKLGMQVLVTDAQGDVAVQNSNIDNFIVQGANAVGAISMDLDGSIPAVEAAKTAGIPYISFLSSVRDDGNYDGYIYIDSQNYDAGYMQGQFLAEVLPENAQILYLTDRPSDQQYVDRKAGLLDGVITVGLDGSEDALALIEAGEMTMSVLQDARGQAIAGAEVLKQIRDGVDPATIEDIYVPFQAVTEENVADYMEN